MKKFGSLFRRTLLFSFSFLLLTASFHSVRAAGENDPTFNGGLLVQPNRHAYAVKRQSDGKILVGGDFSNINGHSSNSIARLNADATPDRTFNPPNMEGTVRSIAIQSDGKILIGGKILVPYLTNYALVVRLNTDGTFDNTFRGPETLNASYTSFLVKDIAIGNDGKIFLAGDFSYNPQPNSTKSYFARVNTDGSTDTTFNPSGIFTDIYDIEVQPDGKIIGATIDSGSGSRFIKRFNADGTEDSSFNALVSGVISTLKVLPDGRILIGGGFNFVNNIARTYAARLNPNGTLDTSFNVTPNNGIIAIEVDAGGGILLSGFFTTFNGVSRRHLVRVDDNGNLDAGFGNNLLLNQAPTSILPLPDGRIILSVTVPADLNTNEIIALRSNGTLDNSFKAKVGTIATVRKILVQADGRILVLGDFRAINSFTRKYIARFLADGSADESFDPPYDSNVPYAYAMALQADGKILVGGGTPYSTPLKRLNSDGTIDGSFISSVNGDLTEVTEIAVQPDGKILVGGRNSNALFTYRLNTDGSRDRTFNSTYPNSSGTSIKRIVIQPDGKILIAGEFTIINGNPRGRIARLNSDGSLDSTFNPLGGASSTINDIDLQSDGKIIIGGLFLSYNGTTRNYLARLNSDGNLDTSFTTGTNAGVRAIKIESNGKILVGGEFTTVNNVSRQRLVRLNPDSTLDLPFNSGVGFTDQSVSALAIQPDNKIIVGGSFTRFNNLRKGSIVRLLNSSTGRTAFDYDGDGRADVSVFRPSTGFWYTSLDPAINYGAFQFGQSGDRIVPADYDGDGKTDLAVYRNGNWYLQRSSQGFSGTQFGDSNDVPVPADYDGDGRADIAVFRPGNGTWYLLQSTAGFSAIALGLGTDKPVPGDYNGDGRAEVAVFRPSNGYWYTSTNPATGYGGVQFGSSEDKPVPADYDGDGKTDLAVFRPSNGTWYLLQSTNGFAGIQFGFGTDAPTPADYDGDGRADIAVFRSGNWYLNRTTQGFTGIQFGTSTDLPTPNAYVR